MARQTNHKYNVKDTSDCSSILWIQCSIYLIKQVKRSRITSLYGKDKGQSNNSFLSPRQLLHGLCLSLPSKRNLQQTPFYLGTRERSSYETKYRSLYMPSLSLRCISQPCPQYLLLEVQLHQDHHQHDHHPVRMKEKFKEQITLDVALIHNYLAVIPEHHPNP